MFSLMTTDHLTSMFTTKHREMELALDENDLPRAAAAVGVLIGLVIADLPETEAVRFFSSYVYFDAGDDETIYAAAERCIRWRSYLD